MIKKEAGPVSAGVWVRLKAFMLDYIVLLLYLAVVAVIAMLIFPDLQLLFTGSAATAQLAGFSMVTLPISLYFAFSDSRFFGGTFGKKKMKIQVVGQSGRNIGFFRSAFRVACKFLPWELSHFLAYRLMALGDASVPGYLIATGGMVYGLMFVYIITAILSRDNRTLYDRMSGTKVVIKT